MKDEQRPIYFHPAWVRAIHRFCRNYETQKELPRGGTPLSQIQSFHQQWYQNKSYRFRAEQIVECCVCKADFEEAKRSGGTFPNDCPPEVRLRARNFGIKLGGNAVANHATSLG